MIAVMGAGAFGTALAIALSKTKKPVTLWARSKKHVDEMSRQRSNNTYLAGAPFPAELRVTPDIGELTKAKAILLAIPLQNLRSGLVALPETTSPLIACCKGIELKTGLGPTEIIESVVPDATAAILTGPSFAADIAIGRPTALTLACQKTASSVELQRMLSTSSLRLYRTTDTVGAQLGGALKNVIAIACGAVIGAGLGESARAATMTRGFAEMQRIGASFGAEAETLMGLSGLGDLALTCASEKSRNFRLGLSIGRHEPFDPNITVEGAATARAMAELAIQRKLDVPLTAMVATLLDGTTNISDAVTELMKRPLKEE